MKKTEESYTTHDPNFVTEKAVYFYTPRYYAFDNFSAFIVEIWDLRFPTSEHAYQWKKYTECRPDIAQRIIEAPSAYAAKKIADAHKGDFDPSWHDEKLQRMEEILRAKLEQHQKVKDLLFETGEKEIVEKTLQWIAFGALEKMARVKINLANSGCDYETSYVLSTKQLSTKPCNSTS